MGRMYSATIEGISIAAASEIFYIKAGASSVVRVHEIKITQDESETSEQLPLRVYKTDTDQSTKGTAGVLGELQESDTAFSGTVRTAILTVQTFATPSDKILSEAQNMLNGFHILPTPECRIDVSPGSGIAVKLDAAPAAALKFSGYIIFEEIGG